MLKTILTNIAQTRRYSSGQIFRTVPLQQQGEDIKLRGRFASFPELFSHLLPHLLPLTRPYLAGSEAASVPELLQYASDQDCLSLQLAVQEVELDILAGNIREIIESSLHTRGALLFRGLKVVLINFCLIFHSVCRLSSLFSQTMQHSAG